MPECFLSQIMNIFSLPLHNLKQESEWKEKQTNTGFVSQKEKKGASSGNRL